jgi:predicted PurR-regulated permease PerM
VLLSRGLTTPMPVILAGMFGGTISYGLAGLFLGPVVLAVFYELLLAWAKLDEAAGPIESDGTSPPPAVR